MALAYFCFHHISTPEHLILKMCVFTLTIHVVLWVVHTFFEGSMLLGLYILKAKIYERHFGIPPFWFIIPFNRNHSLFRRNKHEYPELSLLNLCDPFNKAKVMYNHHISFIIIRKT